MLSALPQKICGPRYGLAFPLLGERAVALWLLRCSSILRNIYKLRKASSPEHSLEDAGEDAISEFQTQPLEDTATPTVDLTEFRLLDQLQAAEALELQGLSFTEAGELSPEVGELRCLKSCWMEARHAGQRCLVGCWRHSEWREEEPCE